MELTPFSLLGGLIMLAFGVVDYALLRRALYPVLRWRYERMKAQGEQGVEPNLIMDLLKAINFLLLPAAGIVLGDPVLKSLM
jgi:hypothetical protein